MKARSASAGGSWSGGAQKSEQDRDRASDKTHTISLHLIVKRIGKAFLRLGGRRLVAQMVRRDFEQRYVGSAAGWLWGVVHPLVLLLELTFVFRCA